MEREGAHAHDVEPAFRVGERGDLELPLAEEREWARVAGDGRAQAAVLGAVREADRDWRLAGVVREEVRADGPGNEVPLADRLLHAEAALHLTHDGRVEAD